MKQLGFGSQTRYLASENLAQKDRLIEPRPRDAVVTRSQVTAVLQTPNNQVLGYEAFGYGN